MTNAPSPAEVAAAFPPADIAAFLAFCGGEWLALRSQFDLDPDLAAEQDANGWHSSERGELKVAYLEPRHPGDPGGLAVQPADAAGAAQVLLFSAAGQFTIEGSQPAQGQWQLWPDGSLELVWSGDASERRERIWFTKPNLRLRSCIERGPDGTPARASFSSEIRRLSRAGG